MQALQIGDNQISSDRVLQYLAKSQVISQLLREIVIDDLVDRVARERQIDLVPTAAEFDRLRAQIEKISPFQGMNAEQIDAIASRTLKIHKFKQAGWAHKVSSYYESNEHRLHRVVYSMLLVDDGLLAQELFFRIQSGEQSFTEIARQYSQDPNTAHRGGVSGPISIAEVPTAIGSMITSLVLGQLSPLFQLNTHYGFIRLDDWIPAKLDENMQQLLLDELFESWIKEQMMTEFGQTGEISIEQSASTFEPLALIDSEPAKNPYNGLEIPEPWDSKFDPNFARQETIIAQAPEIIAATDFPPEPEEVNSPTVTVVVEPAQRELEVTTEFFFPNPQAEAPLASPTEIDNSSLPTYLPTILPTLDPSIPAPIAARNRSLQLLIGMAIAIALVGLGANYFTSIHRQPPVEVEGRG